MVGCSSVTIVAAEYQRMLRMTIPFCSAKMLETVALRNPNAVVPEMSFKNFALAAVRYIPPQALHLSDRNHWYECAFFFHQRFLAKQSFIKRLTMVFFV